MYFHLTESFSVPCPYGLQITEKCLVPILQLQYLKELILVECPGIDDVGLGILKESCKSLEVLIFSDGLIKVTISRLAIAALNCLI